MHARRRNAGRRTSHLMHSVIKGATCPQFRGTERRRFRCGASYVLCAINASARFRGYSWGGRGAALCRGVTGDTAVEGCPDFEHAVEPLPRATTDADPHAHEHDENQHRDREYKRCFWRHRKSAHGHHTHRTTNNFRARWAEVSLVQPIERGVT